MSSGYHTVTALVLCIGLIGCSPPPTPRKVGQLQDRDGVCWDLMQSGDDVYGRTIKEAPCEERP